MVSSTIPKLKKDNDLIPRKHPDIGKDEKTLFHRTPLTTRKGGLRSTVAVNWHVKVEVGLTKNYSITTSLQQTRSIHQLILKIQHIIGSHEQNDCSNF